MPEIENKKPIVPLYKNDMITAKEKDEITDWQSSLRENLNCARAIDNTLNSNFSDNRLDTDKVLDAVIKDYGAERVSHVLAAQIINNNWDGRYHNDVKAWAKEQTNGLSDGFMKDSRDYYLTAHPVLIDSLAAKVIQREKELDKTVSHTAAEADVAEPPETFTKTKDKIKEITDKIETGIKELFDGEKFKKYLDTMSKFHNYSFNNTMLIAMQKPDATLVAGFNAWKNKFERNVNKGEKGIQIFAPAPYKVKKEQTKIDPDTELPVLDTDGNPIKEEVEVTIPAFKVVSVFDVSQTSGKELPSIGVDELRGNVKDYEKFWSAIRKTSPVPIRFEDIHSSAKGFYNNDNKEIAIKKNMSELQTIKTAIHEIAHAKLHDRDLNKTDILKPKDRRTEEVEAESIAYTVCQHFGIDTSDYSFAYIASWGSGKDMPELKSSLETIRSTASELITTISDKYLELENEKAQEQASDKSEKMNIIGNTAFKDIENKQYLRLKSATAEKVAEKLTEQNIHFSGRINGDKTTLTISKADIGSYKAIIAEIAEKEKAAFAREQSADVSEPQEKNPVQKNTETEPKKDPAKPKKSNIIGNTAYADIADKSYAKLETKKALAVADILDKQGVKFSGRTVNDKTTLTISKADTDKYKTALAAVNRAMQKDATQDKSADVKHFSGKMPDDNITVDERNAYGYNSDELLPLTTEKALEFFDNDTVSVYLLYSDGTEGQAIERSDIENHAGIFGVEVKEWEHYQASQARMNKLVAEEPSKEALLLNGTESAVGIYQLKDTPETTDIRFSDSSYLEKKGVVPDRENYTLVYSFPVLHEDLQDKSAFLEQMFEKFNVDRPKDFLGHSPAVSDVVVIQENGELSAHYVDRAGFTELNNFGAVRENPVKTVENAEKQEQKAAREPVKKPEQKRSVRGYLKEASARPQKPSEDKTKGKEKGVEL